jgi:hypothetical protein
MALTLSDVMQDLHGSRKHFLKHLNGLTDEQWSWKPYPQCKSILESVIHLIGDDRAALQSLQTNKEPDYAGVMNITIEEAGGDREKALSMLAVSHDALCTWLEAQYSQVSMDTELCIWGDTKKLATGIAYLSSEDFYHAGQVAFCRLATDPTWDYYVSIYDWHG